MKIVSLLNLSLIFLISCGDKHPENDQSINDEPEIEVMHPRIYWTENPANHAIISWTSDKPGKSNRILYDTISKTNHHNYSFQTIAEDNGKITYKKSDAEAGVPESYYHHADLENLQPNRKYFYRFCTDSSCSPEYYFITAPENQSQISLLFGGDSRVGDNDNNPDKHNDRKKINKLVAKLIEEDTSILALVHGADYGMNANWEYLYHWFNDHEYCLTKDNRVIPLIISRGNHDHEIGFTENFRLGEVTERNSDGYYYTTKLTDSISLITLNTETSMAGYQLKWLQNELSVQRPKNKWLLVQYHKPAYPAVKKFNREDFARVRKYWVPLFEEFKIDLALESDGHALKKTIPILKDKPNKKGIIYIGEGGMGVPQRTPDPNRWYFQNGGYISANHHVWKLIFNDNILQVVAIGEDGDILVDFELNRRNISDK